MADLTALTTPFGLLDAETQAALMAHGGPYEFWDSFGAWTDIDEPSWSGTVVYRVKPQPTTKPSIDWSHVAPEYQWLARDANGRGFLYEDAPRLISEGGVWATSPCYLLARHFASYTPGTCDWRESLVQRPEDV